MMQRASKGGVVCVPNIQAFHERLLPPSFNLMEASRMCRNIKTLFNVVPDNSSEEDEVHAASLQFVRKISGFNKPSKVNETAFLAAVDAVAAASHRLLSALETKAPPKDRSEEAAKARARAAQRPSR